MVSWLGGVVMGFNLILLKLRDTFKAKCKGNINITITKKTQKKNDELETDEWMSERTNKVNFRERGWLKIGEYLLI